MRGHLRSEGVADISSHDGADLMSGGRVDLRSEGSADIRSNEGADLISKKRVDLMSEGVLRRSEVGAEVV